MVARGFDLGANPLSHTENAEDAEFLVEIKTPSRLNQRPCGSHPPGRTPRVRTPPRAKHQADCAWTRRRRKRSRTRVQLPPQHAQQAGLISAETEKFLRGANGMRNIMVHRYATVDLSALSGRSWRTSWTPCLRPGGNWPVWGRIPIPQGKPLRNNPNNRRGQSSAEPDHSMIKGGGLRRADLHSQLTRISSHDRNSVQLQ